MVTRLSGGLTPGDGADPRTFPAIWNATATDIEAAESDIDELEAKNIPAFGTASPSDGQVLAYSTAISGYEPTDAGGGAILQVVSATYSTEQTTTSSSFVTTGMSAAITPSATSSEILVLYSGAGGMNGTAANSVNFTLFRGDTTGTNLGDSSGGLLIVYGDISSTYRNFGSLNMSFLDSPNTTSAQTYTVAMKASAGQEAIAQRGGIPSVLTLIEVAG